MEGCPLEKPTNAIILADSLNTATGDRLTTFLLPRFPKCLQAQLNTHRALSRNSASARAIPVSRMIERIKADPYYPSWTQNQRGMQGGALNPVTAQNLDNVWSNALESAVANALLLRQAGAHKQEVNRLLEPFMRIPVLVTATEWDNFFRLRCDHATQPDFQVIAQAMRQAREESTPTELLPGQWHMVFSEQCPEGATLSDRLAIATGRAARLSYANHYGEVSPEDDRRLHDDLIAQGHASPLEHCAQAMLLPIPCRNFKGFRQYRDFVEAGQPVEAEDADLRY